MDSRGRWWRVEDDDALLSSVAGVPLTRLVRIGPCFVWAVFWCARFLLTDAMLYLSSLKLKSASSELLGVNPFDQGFSICMIWLSVEVAAIVWHILKMGVAMLIAKTSKPLRNMVLERLSREQLEAELEKRNKADANKPSEPNKRKG